VVDEKKVEEKSAEVTPKEEEKETNKTFTQSEFDTRIAEIEKKHKEQLGSVSEIQTQLETLAKEKKERELKEMSDIEQKETIIKDLMEQKELLEIKEAELSKKVAVNDVLNSPEFANLPRAYKSMVTGENQDDILANAKTVLDEFNEDISKLGKKVEGSALPPGVRKEQSPDNLLPKSLKEELDEKMKQRYEKLQ